MAAPVENRSIVAITPNVEERRLTNRQNVALPVYIPADGSPPPESGLWATNPRALILISKLFDVNIQIALRPLRRPKR